MEQFESGNFELSLLDQFVFNIKMNFFKNKNKEKFSKILSRRQQEEIDSKDDYYGWWG